MGEQPGERERERQTDTDRESERHTERERERHTQRQRERKRERQRGRGGGGRKREKEKERARERERVNSYVQVLTDAVNVHTFDTNTQPLLEMPPQNHLHATQSSPPGSHVINITIPDRHHHLHRHIVIEIPS